MSTAFLFSAVHGIEAKLPKNAQVCCCLCGLLIGHRAVYLSRAFRQGWLMVLSSLAGQCWLSLLTGAANLGHSNSS